MNMLTPETPCTTVDLSVLILTLNEEGNIGPLLQKITEIVVGLDISYEFIVVDGASTDNTVEEASAQGARCIQQRRLGYGGALREGIAKASGTYVLTLDADWSHPPELISALWKERCSADILIASRYMTGGCSAAGTWRFSLSVLLNRFFAWTLSLPFRDASSGYRLCRRSAVSPAECEAENFDILEEVLIRALCNGYTIREIPLQYQRRMHGVSHASCLAFARSFLPTLFRMWVLRNSFASADYDHRAFYSVIPPQRYWQRRRYKIVKGFVSNKGLVLDIGCGSSRIIQSLGERGIALDVSLPKLRFLNKTNSLRSLASTFSLPFGNETLDNVIHSEVLEHVAFSEKIFLEMNRVLKIGGTLVVGTPDYGRASWRIIEWLYKHILPNAYGDEHITRYNRHMLTELLAEYGFRIIGYKYICGGELIIKAEKIAHMHSSSE